MKVAYSVEFLNKRFAIEEMGSYPGEPGDTYFVLDEKYIKSPFGPQLSLVLVIAVAAFPLLLVAVLLIWRRRSSGRTVAGTSRDAAQPKPP